jgi:glycosyltransferase involved in cell wall biosynthesis
MEFGKIPLIMNILGIYLINQIRTGGDRDYIELLELLSLRNNNVVVIFNSLLDYSPVKNIQKIEIPIYYKRHGFPPASYLFKKYIKKNIMQIKKLLNTNERYVIHIHGDIYLKSAVFLKKYFGFSIFYASRNNDIDRARILRKNKLLSPKEHLFSLLYENIDISREKQVARYSTGVAFLNKYERDCFIRRTNFNISRTVVISNNIGLPHFEEKYRNKNKSTTVNNLVYVGALSSRKGFWEYIKVAALLKKRGYSHIKCFALGREENIHKSVDLIKKLDVEDMVFIEGYKNPFDYFEKYDLFVYPTPYEAFGNVLTEALHTGCPVFASNTGGIPELLDNPELLFEYGNTKEITDKIERCILDTDYYMHIKNYCIRRANYFHFDWAERFEKAMAEFLGREARASHQK